MWLEPESHLSNWERSRNLMMIPIFSFWLSQWQVARCQTLASSTLRTCPTLVIWWERAGNISEASESSQALMNLVLSSTILIPHWISFKLVSVLSILSSVAEIWCISSFTTCLMAAMRWTSMVTTLPACPEDCLVGYCIGQWVMTSMFAPLQTGVSDH